MIREIKNDKDKVIIPWDPKDLSRKTMERHWAIIDMIQGGCFCLSYVVSVTFDYGKCKE